MLYHSLSECDGLLRIIVTCKIGVEFFLFLSGIGLYYSLKRNYRLASFYKRRFLRVLPEYLLFAIPLYLFYMISHHGSVIDFVLNITTINFFFGKGIYFWFVHIILICYLISPIYFRITEKSQSVFIIPIAFLLLAYFISFSYREYQMILPRYASFLLGMGVGRLAFKKKEIKHTSLLVAISPILIGIMYLSTYKGEIAGLWLEPAYYFWFIIPLLLYMALIVNKCRSICRFFTFLGSISFELYLLHEYFFLRAARYLLPGIFMPCIVSILAVIPFAWMLQQLNLRVVKVMFK